MLVSLCLDPGRPWSDLRAIARHAEQAGLHALWMSDHFMPYAEDGRPPDGPVLEGWTTLTALGALTSRIRLGTLVLGATYRHPAVVANMAATLDHVTGGRFVLGLGAGWQQNEHTAYGIDLPPPGPRLAAFGDHVAAVRSLLTQPRSSLDTEHVRLRDAPCDPRPVQRPLPLLVGGGGEQRTMRVAARYADQWHVWGTPAEFEHKSVVLDRRCEEVGRDPVTLHRVSGSTVDLDQPGSSLRHRLRGYAAAGAGEFVLRDHRDDGPDDARRLLDSVAEAARQG